MKKTIFAAIVAACMCACMSQKEMLDGGYGQTFTPTEAEYEMFAKLAIAQQMPNWMPKKVSRQVVAGINHKFICVDAFNNQHEVVIFQPLPGQGEPRVLTIDGQQ